jgi:hypothetical protein
MEKLIVMLYAVVGLSLTAVAQQTDSTHLVNPQQHDVIIDVEQNDLRSNDEITEKDEAHEAEKDKASQAGRTIGAQLKDEKLESKEGPDGEPVFVNANGQYYYIDKNGDKVIVSKSTLKLKK